MIQNILYDTNVMQYKFWEFYRVKEFNIIDKTLLLKKKSHFFMITFYILNVFFVTLYNILQYYKNTFQINAVLSNILELYTKNPEKIIRVSTKKIYIYLHLSDAFIQSNLQLHSGYTFFFQYMCSLGIEPTTLCAADAMLYHWATQEHIYNIYILINITVFNIDNRYNIFLGNKSTYWNDFWRIVWNWKTITGINDPLKHIKVENSYCKW